MTEVLGKFVFREGAYGEREVEWLACPKKEMEGGAPYQVFANVTGVDVEGGGVEECVGFGAATGRVVGEREGAEVWEYV